MSNNNQPKVVLISYTTLINEYLQNHPVSNRTNNLFVIANSKRTHAFTQDEWQPICHDEIGMHIELVSEKTAREICEEQGWKIIQTIR